MIKVPEVPIPRILHGKNEMMSETFSAYAVNERNRAIQPEVLHAAKRCFIDWFSTTTAGGVKMPAIGFQAAFAEDMIEEWLALSQRGARPPCAQQF